MFAPLLQNPGNSPFVRGIIVDRDELLNQCREPKGWLGRLGLRDMNRRHSKLTDWGLRHVAIKSGDTILDVGCGGGRTIHKLASIASQGKVFGVDHSEASVSVSRRRNSKFIETGRVEIRRASVSRLPFPDRQFDLVTAIETHYYWPNLPADLREVRRVLKTGGTFLVVAEAYKGGKNEARLQMFAQAMTPLGYSHLSVEENRALLSSAGFSEVDMVEDYDKGWLCALGRVSGE
jgi:ubiquinone/menaquinone biosynthesis C-methylase UbiE